MLDVIENFDFSNVASQLGIQVLDFLKGTFDDADLEQLKNFVKKQLTTQDKTYMQFESGRLTHRGHLAAIIKMALVLKKLTLEGGMLEVSKKPVPENWEEISEDEEKSTSQNPEFMRQLKHITDVEWTKFCSGPLQLHETKWVKKLEEYVPADRNKGEDQETHDDDDEDSDDTPSNGFKPRSSERSRKHRGGDRYSDENAQTSEEKEEEESSIEQMLQTGAFKKNLLAHRNKVVHIKNGSH